MEIEAGILSVVYVGINNLEIKRIPMSDCLSGELILKIEAAGICKTDVTILKGKHLRAKPPLVLGHEFTGRVKANFSNRTDLSIGDLVTVFPVIACNNCSTCRSGFSNLCPRLKILGIDCNGGMAEEISIPSHCAIKLPTNVDGLSGALIEPLAVAGHAIRISEIDVNDKVVILGAGTIGQCIAQILHAKGITNVMVLNRTQSKLKLVQPYVQFTSSLDNNGHKDTINWTEGLGADVLIDTTGVEPSVKLFTKLTRPGGKIIIVGIQDGPISFDFREFFFKGQAMIVSRLYKYNDFIDAISMTSNGMVHPEKIITGVFPFTEALEAFREATETNSVKVILKPK